MSSSSLTLAKNTVKQNERGIGYHRGFLHFRRMLLLYLITTNNTGRRCHSLRRCSCTRSHVVGAMGSRPPPTQTDWVRIEPPHQLHLCPQIRVLRQIDVEVALCAPPLVYHWLPPWWLIVAAVAVSTAEERTRRYMA